MSEPPLIVVVGPTAAGKTELAVRVALEIGAEVVSADSMQVYRHFDVGTAKPDSAERRGVPHHLIDVAEPGEPFSAARFVTLADAAIAEIRGRGRRIVVAGGTGLYVRALLHGLFEAPPPDPAIRARHQAIRDRDGVATLHAALERVDPEAAQRINPADFVRVSRALEVYEQSGRSISSLQAGHRFAERRYPAVRIGLSPARDALRQRIEQRVDRMMVAGWLDEVRDLVRRGLGESAPMGALGYRQLHAHLKGALDLVEAVRQTKRDTWRFARRQLNWFGSEPDTIWFQGTGAEVSAQWLGDALGRDS